MVLAAALVGAALCAAAGARAPATHEGSLSISRIAVEGRAVRHELFLQPEGLFEVLPGLDADGDLALDAAELAAGRERIEGYLARAYRLFEDEGHARELERRVVALEPAPPPFDAPPGAARWVRVASVLEASEPLRVLALEMRLFFLTSPDHRDLCALRWDGARAPERAFSLYEPRGLYRRADLPLRSPWGWALAGFFALALAPRHLLFLLVLFAGSGRPRAAWRSSLAFAAARVLCFALAAAGLSPLPARFAALAVALSSAYVGASVLARRGERPFGLEAAAFGAVHGLALAEVALAETSALERPLTPLLGFALGIELAQLSVFGAALCAQRALDALRRARAGAGARLARTALPALAAAGVAFGLYWFAEGAGWL